MIVLLTFKVLLLIVLLISILGVFGTKDEKERVCLSAIFTLVVIVSVVLFIFTN